jgi:hypothetical protein
MANTVNIISAANTFYEWMGATINLTNENNTLAKGDYTKDSGSLILNGSPQSLRANGQVVLYNQLLVTGAGSSATVDNNLGVGGQAYFTNTNESTASIARSKSKTGSMNLAIA